MDVVQTQRRDGREWKAPYLPGDPPHHSPNVDIPVSAFHYNWEYSKSVNPMMASWHPYPDMFDQVRRRTIRIHPPPAEVLYGRDRRLALEAAMNDRARGLALEAVMNEDRDRRLALEAVMNEDRARGLALEAVMNEDRDRRLALEAMNEDRARGLRPCQGTNTFLGYSPSSIVRGNFDLCIGSHGASEEKRAVAVAVDEGKDDSTEDESKQCPVCMENLKAVSGKCGHLLCFACSKKIRQDLSNCPTCRERWIPTVRVYL